MFPLLRRLGAVAILTTGAIHLQQLIVQDFASIPVIRVLFILNVAGSCAVGLGLLAPVERALAGGRAEAVVATLATVGLLIAIGSLAGLLISENGGLFGLRDTRVSTAAVLAIIAEAAAVLCLTPVLARTVSGARRRGTGSEPSVTGDGRVFVLEQASGRKARDPR